MGVFSLVISDRDYINRKAINGVHAHNLFLIHQICLLPELIMFLLRLIIVLCDR